jgi:UDP-3-O-[3-hydroxymyristoyl] glucosamine N-acyltransferase
LPLQDRTLKKTLAEIAEYIGGRIVGDGSIVIINIKDIDEAGSGDLSFIANRKYLKKLETTRASAVIIHPGIESKGKNFITVPDPYIAFGKVLALFYPEYEERPGISTHAFIEDGAVVSDEAIVYPGVTICRGANIKRLAVLYPGVFIGRNAVIEEGSILYPNVTVYRRCIIGKRVILHAGVVVGSDGFGFAAPGGTNFKIPQVGIVQIDDDVEIGANSTIDRGTMGKTWIQKGVKIDNLVQIAHNVVIGEYSVIVSQVGISGSAKLGKGVIIGGQAGVVGHIHIGDHVMAAARAGIHKDVPPNKIVAGAPHRSHREWLRIEATMPKIPDMHSTLSSLTKRVEMLEKKN